MKIDDVRKMIEESLGQNLVRIEVPSTKKQHLFKPMTVGMKKSVAKFSLADQSEESTIEFQIAKLALIKTLCPEIDLAELTDIDFISLLCNIRLNNSVDPLELIVKCSNDECKNRFEHTFNFEQVIENCNKFNFQVKTRDVKIDDKTTLTLTISNPKIQDILELEKHLLETEDLDKRMQERIVTSPYLHIVGLAVNGEAVEDFKEKGLMERISVLDELHCSKLLDGNETSVFSEIMKTFDSDEYSKIFGKLTCPKCNQEMEGVFTTDSFFTI